MEKQISEIMVALGKELCKDSLIGIVYNPYKEGMKYDDCNFLKYILSQDRYTSPLFILSGHGGYLAPGIYFPHIIKNAVKNYGVYVPSTCCSALCYTLLKSTKLLVGRNTQITQIDPTIQLGNGEVHRAIKIIKDSKFKNTPLGECARDVFHLAEEHVKILIDKPSLFREDGRDYFEHLHLDDLINLFMNKEDHFSFIDIKELNNLGAKIEDLSESKADILANRLIQVCQDFAILKDVRVVFVSSIPIKIIGEKDGVLICPLN